MQYYSHFEQNKYLLGSMKIIYYATTDSKINTFLVKKYTCSYAKLVDEDVILLTEGYLKTQTRNISFQYK